MHHLCTFLKIIFALYESGEAMPLITCQKQSFADVLQKRWSYKFLQFQRKTPLLGSLFNKVVDLSPISPVTNSKSKNKKLNFELLTRSQKIKQNYFELLRR